MMFQKFKTGDRVHITANMPPSKSHFPCGVNATVINTYAQRFGGDDYKSYCLDIDGEGFVSWYNEDLLEGPIND